ncbi:hypothetical protein CYMTET_18487 [Cymbomonas tetramitiformis]|uniref:Right handed beta helix domain-containing protein n=1 Tax=Cymbomonas tetramitiformis TaxID=36881 RepID=A0AAE0G9B3_9CHLO|nr:hypothetical protein CYMTET_18487 [Cymbomonas tetramitiformis]
MDFSFGRHGVPCTSRGRERWIGGRHGLTRIALSISIGIGAVFSAWGQPPPPPPAPCACTGNNTGVAEDLHPEYGTYCAPWDILDDGCVSTTGGDVSANCTRFWCYVPEGCGALAVNTTDSVSLHFSYDICSTSESLVYSSNDNTSNDLCHTPPPPGAPPESSPCQEVFDSVTTCVTTDRLYGKYADAGVNDNPADCCLFCIENYPLSTHTDYFPNAGPDGWCNCYASCDETRCVSQACHGSDGGGVTTQFMLVSPPPSPPATASPPPEPPMPPAPPLVQNGSVVVIENVTSRFAAEQLRGALENSSVDTVVLRTDVTLTTGPLPDVARVVAILGECLARSCEVSAEGQHRIFSLSGAGALYLEALALRHGYSDSDGGALHLSTGTNATLYNCTLEANEALGDGGAVFLETETDFTMSACNANSNIARGGGGGGVVYGGEAVRILVADSLLCNNLAESGNGGALMSDTNSIMHVKSSRLDDNWAKKGGAVFIFLARLLAEGTSMSGNTASGYGGAVMCYQECQVDIQECQLQGNVATENGGALYGHSRTAFNVGPATNILSNKALGDFNGGGVFVYEDSIIHLFNSTVMKNYAANGGGIALNERSTLELDQGVLFENVAKVRGGGVYAQEGCTLNLTAHTVVSGNEALAGSGGGVYGSSGSAMVVADGEVSGNLAAEEGGGLFFEDLSNLTLRGTQIQNNTAKMGGGGLCMGAETQLSIAASQVEINRASTGYGGGLSVKTGASIELAQGTVVSGNSAETGGGASVEARSTLVLTNTTIEGNTADVSGGGVYMFAGAMLTMEGTTISGNKATNGGGIFQMTSRDLLITDGSSILDNEATNSGGGVYLSENTLATFSVGARVEGNVCQMSGAGILIGQGSTVYLIAGSVVRGNRANREGGGIAMLRGEGADVMTELWLESSEVSGNSALYYSGGGLSSDLFCAIYVANSTIAGNAAGFTGGGLNGLSSEVYVLQSTVLLNNTALVGGAISIHGNSEAGVLWISDALLLNNHAVMMGGGVYMKNCLWSVIGLPIDANFSAAAAEWEAGMAEHAESYKDAYDSHLALCEGHRVCILDNLASEAAAVLYTSSTGGVLANVFVGFNVGFSDIVTSVVGIMDKSHVNVSSCSFMQNVGSALTVEAGCGLTLVDTEVVNHTALRGASLHVLQEARVEVWNCTFSGGQATEGGAVFSQGDLTIAESHFEANLALANGAALYLALEHQSTALRGCRFANNVAAGAADSTTNTSQVGNGGVMYMEVRTSEGGANLTRLDALTFHGNSALRGGAIGFWQPWDLDEARDAPACEECTVVNATNTAAYSSERGWSTAAYYLEVAEMQMEEASWQKVTHSIEVRIIDAYQETVAVDSSSSVDIHFEVPEACGLVEGNMRVQASRGIATFSGNATGLVLKGRPGTVCEVCVVPTLEAREGTAHKKLTPFG